MFVGRVFLLSPEVFSECVFSLVNSFSEVDGFRGSIFLVSGNFSLIIGIFHGSLFYSCLIISCRGSKLVFLSCIVIVFN